MARRQHKGYVATLRHIGLEVTELPPDDEHPDAVSVQDRVCVVDGRAIAGPSAVPSRRGETEAILEVLRPAYPIVELPSPASLDWGDVLITEDALFAGLSERSNEAAVEALRNVLGPVWTVEGVPLPPDLLHLLSGCCYLGNGDSSPSLPWRPSRDPAASTPCRSRKPNRSPPTSSSMTAGPSCLPATRRRPPVSPRPACASSESRSASQKRDGGVTCLSVAYGLRAGENRRP